MFKTLLQQNLKKFDIRGTVSNLVRKYYEQREQEGKVDGIWQEFRKKSRELELNVKKQNADLVKGFTKDIQKSYSLTWQLLLEPEEAKVFTTIHIKKQKLLILLCLVF